jgi:chemotaxis protein CheX
MAAKKSGKTLNLAATLDLNEASALRDKLLSLRGSAVSIDASAVERVGTLGAQVLMAAAKTWDQDKLAFTFTKVSDAFQKTMQLIGVDIHPLLAKEIQ